MYIPQNTVHREYTIPYHVELSNLLTFQSNVLEDLEPLKSY